MSLLNNSKKREAFQISFNDVISTTILNFPVKFKRTTSKLRLKILLGQV